MIELLQFKPRFGLMNASPFCMKAEVFVRLAGLEYRTVDAQSPRAPKRKLPVLRDGDTTVADSEAIVAYLQATYGDRMPPAMAAPETASQLFLRRTLEEHLYFAALRFRWIADEGARQTRVFFDELPAALRGLVFALVRRKIRRDLWGQGLGRHDEATLCAKACADLDAMARTLGADPFFGGAEPAAIDATAYAFLANLVWAPVESPIKAHALQDGVLVAYCERMRSRVGS
jgi:glutathione S-transferase